MVASVQPGIRPPTTESSAFAFECNACGACCNSAPQLTVPELYRHQDRFFGCLALRATRMPSTVRSNDARPFEARFLHSVPNERGLWAAIAGQAFGFSSQNRCSALSSDGKCSLHDTGKPLICHVAPFDSLQPDRHQSDVLEERRAEAGFLGADCITRVPATASRAVAAGPRLLDASIAHDLERHRGALELEKRYWGSRVFAFLSGGEHGVPWHMLPDGNWVEIGVTPALAAIAELSPACRLRTLEYIDAQLVLGETLVRDAVSRKSLLDRDSTQRLRAYLQALTHLHGTMRSRKPPFQPDAIAAAEVERWLGV